MSARKHRLGPLLEDQRQTFVAEYHEKKKSDITNSILWQQKKKEISWNPSLRSYRDGITKISKFCFPHFCKKKTHRRSRHYFATLGQSTATETWIKIVWAILGIFQDAESVRSGNSHVTSPPILSTLHPRPLGMLNRSTRMPSRRRPQNI